MRRALESLEREVARGGGVPSMLRLMHAYDDMGIVRPEHLLSGTKVSVVWSVYPDEHMPATLEVRSGGWATSWSPGVLNDELRYYTEDVRIDYPRGTTCKDRSRAELLAEVGRGVAPGAVVQLLRYEETKVGLPAGRLDEASRWLRPDLEVHVAWCYIGWRDRIEAFSTRAGWEHWVRGRLEELAGALGMDGESLEQHVRGHGLPGTMYELSGRPGGERWSPGIVLHYPVAVAPEAEEPRAP